MTGLRPLSIGEILDGAFSIYRRNFLVMVTTTAVLLLPGALLRLVWPTIGGLVSSFGGMVALVGLTSETSVALLGGQPELARGLQVGLRRTGAVMLAVFLASAVVLLACSPLFAGAAYIGWTMTPERSGLTVLSYLLLVMVLVLIVLVPSSWLTLRYFAVLQIAVLEPTRHFLRRSAVLSRGAFWKISVVWLVGSVIVGVPSFLVGVGEGVATVMSDQGMVGSGVFVASLVLGLLISSLGTPFTAALLTLLYYDQRVRKDGLDVELAVARVAPPVVPTPAGT